MADIAWPSGLQQKLDTQSFKEDLPETTIRSEVDVGIPKIRRRYTKGMANWTVSILATVAEYTTFKTFFNTTIAGGATRFEFVHPIDGVTDLARIVGRPGISPVGGGTYFRIAMTWEILPRV